MSVANKPKLIHHSGRTFWSLVPRSLGEVGGASMFLIAVIFTIEALEALPCAVGEDERGRAPSAPFVVAAD